MIKIIPEFFKGVEHYYHHFNTYHLFLMCITEKQFVFRGSINLLTVEHNSRNPGIFRYFSTGGNFQFSQSCSEAYLTIPPNNMLINVA